MRVIKSMRIRRISIEIQIVFLCIFLVQARIRFCIIDGTIRQMVVCGQCSLLDTAVRNAIIEFDISDPIFYRFDNQRRLMVVPISLYIALPAFRDIPNLSVWIPVRIVHRHIWPSHTAKIVIKL